MQWAQIKTSGNPSEHRKTLFFFFFWGWGDLGGRWSNTETDFPEGLWNLLPWRYSAGHDPGQPVVGDLVWEGD